MNLRPVAAKQKTAYNKLVTHVIQSYEWGEFRESLGIPVLRYGIYHQDKLSTAFQLTLHKIPFTNQYVGYLPKGPKPDKELAEALKKIGKEKKCAFIKIEPDVILRAKPEGSLANPDLIGANASTSETSHSHAELIVTSSEILRYAQNDKANASFIKSPKPLFTKYNFVLDLTKSEEELLKRMHQKTRYNIRVAQKHGVKVEIRTDDAAFEIYQKLYFETTMRQGYHGHNKEYHLKAWNTLKNAGMARILIASFENQPLTAWMLLNFKDTLYYPYGGSSKTHPEVMANNLVAWEAIKSGKKLGLKKFDMWGALGPDADPKDPWFGFHKFKQGYGGKLEEYIGTYDLVFNWPVYLAFTVIDRLTPLKVFLLKLLRK